MAHPSINTTCHHVVMCHEASSIIKDFLVHITKLHGSSKTPPRMATVLYESILSSKRMMLVFRRCFLMMAKLTLMASFHVDEHPLSSMSDEFSSFQRLVATHAYSNGSSNQTQALFINAQTSLSSTKRAQCVMANVNTKACARTVNACVEQVSRVTTVKLPQVSLIILRGRQH